MRHSRLLLSIVLVVVAITQPVRAQRQTNAARPGPQLPTAFYDVTSPVRIGDWTSDPANPLDDQDDWKALQALVDHVSKDSQGGTLYFPNGLYYLSRPLVIPANHAAVSANGNVPLFGLTFQGASLGATLYCTGNEGGIVLAGAENQDQLELPAFVRRFCLRDLRIVDSAVNGPDWKKSRSGIGLSLKGAEHCVFENVEILGFDMGLVVALGSPNNSFTNISVQMPKTYGIWITSEGMTRAFGGRSWHTDNFWNNIRVSGFNSFEMDGAGRPEAGIKMSGPYVGDQHFVQAIVGFCKVGVHLLGLPSANATEGYNNDVKLSSLICDMNEHQSLRIERVSNVRVSDAFFGVRGVTILESSEVMISNSWFNGDRSKWSATGTLCGLEVHHASAIGIQNCTFHGFDMVGHFVNVITSTVSGVKAHCSTPCPSDFIGFRIADAVPMAPYVRGSADNSFSGNVFVVEPNGLARAHYGIVEQVGAGVETKNHYVHNVFRGGFAARYLPAGSGSKWVE